MRDIDIAILFVCLSIRLNGAKYRWGMNTSRFSTNTSLYIAYNTR